MSIHLLEPLEMCSFLDDHLETWKWFKVHLQVWRHGRLHEGSHRDGSGAVQRGEELALSRLQGLLFGKISRSFKLCILLERGGCSPQLVEGDQLDRAEDRGCREEAGHGEFPSRLWVSMEPPKNTFSRCSCRPRSTGRRWRRSCETSAKTSLPSLTTSSLPKLPTQSPRWNTGHVDGWIIQLGYEEDYGGHIMVKVSKVSL